MIHHFLDPGIWAEFEVRTGDIVVASYQKAGTTWLQQIVGQLLTGGSEDLVLSEISPWIDAAFVPRADRLATLNAQAGRRFYKTHLPADMVSVDPLARYLYIGRDGRDILWSLYNHHSKFLPELMTELDMLSSPSSPPVGMPPDSVLEYFDRWLDEDGLPWWSLWDSVRSWWALRGNENVLHVHFTDLKSDLEGEIERIAAFLDIPVDPEFRETVIDHCGFRWMKDHADLCVPYGGVAWNGGSETFLNKGTNGRWRDTLTPDRIARYEKTARRELGGACAVWLESGSMP